MLAAREQAAFVLMSNFNLLKRKTDMTANSFHSHGGRGVSGVH